ncbi:carbohydrate kinase FGGY [Meiothermus ruber H328]|nr:carbohydrate kinase FGGY [Meiothermus ruber H328]
MKPLAIGLDFGTESARALLLDLERGQELAVAVEPYPHGVLTHRLPSGAPLPPLWALHHPADYLQVSRVLLQKMRLEAHQSGGTVVGIGLDATASSPLPTDASGVPLALKEAFRYQPHAYLKLWKHHAAEPYAQAINQAHPGFLQMYGGKTSAEWSLAKAWQVLEEAPEIWEATARWIEVGDWLVWPLSGEEVRSSCQAGYKAHWQPEGYPEAAQLRALRPGLEGWLDKLAWPQPVGQKAGGLSQAWAQRTGLPAGIPVATASIDAHAAVLGVGVQESGVLVAILGTSSCHLALSPSACPVPGIAGIVADGILPGLYGYECGQPASGDMLAWWVRTLAWAAQEPEQAVFERLNLELSQRGGGGGGGPAIGPAGPGLVERLPHPLDERKLEGRLERAEPGYRPSADLPGPDRGHGPGHPLGQGNPGTGGGPPTPGGGYRRAVQNPRHRTDPGQRAGLRGGGQRHAPCLGPWGGPVRRHGRRASAAPSACGPGLYPQLRGLPRALPFLPLAG